MSSITWTPTEVASELARARLRPWRAVEAQHVVTTRPLVDSAAEQEILEEALEATKPGRLPGTENLHYLLFTPFRYPPPQRGSRFRAPTDRGVFYAAESRRTACAELGYWRWRFLSESPALERLEPLPQTLLRVSLAGRAVDLRKSPFAHDRAAWTHREDYSRCQAFAEVARAAGAEMIRYASVRDPRSGGCVALLSPRGFADSQPLEVQTWRLYVTRERAHWTRDDPLSRESLEFDASLWRPGQPKQAMPDNPRQS